MRKTAVSAALHVTIMAGSVVFFAGCPGNISQPIKFNHKKHTQSVGLDCAECHQFYKTSPVSGIPGVEVCKGCHQAALTDSPEEKKLLEYINKGEEVPWERLYTVPDHVFYSHSRHVVVGKLECRECHGEIASMEKPPSTPLKKITMTFCIKCHQNRKVTTDCSACHL